MRRLLAVMALIFPLICSAADLQVGVAKVDVSPTSPVRLSGYAARKAESEGVEHPLYARAIAIEWSTALVEPPSTIVRRIALMKLWRVTIFFGVRSFSSSVRIMTPAFLHSSILAGSSAGMEEE